MVVSYVAKLTHLWGLDCSHPEDVILWYDPTKILIRVRIVRGGGETLENDPLKLTQLTYVWEPIYIYVYIYIAVTIYIPMGQ